MTHPSSETPAAIRYESVTENLSRTAWEFLDQCQDRMEMPTLTVMTGDRISCCKELIVARMVMHIGDETRECIAGICSLAPTGEQDDMRPTIVGVAVDPLVRKRGIGKELLQRGIIRMRGLILEHNARLAALQQKFGDDARELIEEQQLQTSDILVQAVSAGGAALARSVLQSPEGATREEYADVVFQDFSRF